MSREDHLIKKAEKELRTTLLQEDPCKELSEDFFDQMHDKIMAGVEKTEIKKPKLWSGLRWKLKPESRRRIGVGSSVGAFLLMVLALNGVANHYREVNRKEFDVVQEMINESHEKPEDLAQVMGFQREDDFFIDVASQKVQELESSEVITR